MSYTSFKFIAFVAVTVTVYFLFPVKKYQWMVLLAASYAFYLMAGYKYAAFIVFTTISVYYLALAIDKIAQRASEELKAHKQDWDREQKKEYKAQIDKKKRRIMALAVVVNIGILAFLKYSNFLIGSLGSLAGLCGLDWSAPTLKLFLPLGISFYTFQSVGYVVDVYRGKFPAERNLAKLALFVSFFPQIIQGPISFYDKLAYQLYEPHSVDFTRMKRGAELVLWGFFKKLVIADRAVVAINCISGNYTAYSGTAVT
ncbi:MAG: MBOAT family protein, partial [Oscillospiraceae bacterium]|nr:MBOAT family protein [Oscillospiraceae bacterium]